MSDSVRYGQGAQTIRCVPVDRHGNARIVSATYSIVDLREAEGTSRRTVVASTAATPPSVSTTISAAAGPATANPRRVSLTSATGVRVGGRYLLRSGASEQAVTVATINGADVELVTPVRQAFASGSSWLGLELEGTFPSSVANDETYLDAGGGPFQAIWVYTIDGDVHVTGKELWLTRYGLDPWVTPDEVLRMFPGLASSTGPNNDPRAAIAAATDELVAHLQATGSWRRDPAYFRGSMAATMAVRKWALRYLCLGSRSEALLELAQTFDSEARSHATGLTQGRPDVRSVALHPVDDVAVSKRDVGGIFAPG